MRDDPEIGWVLIPNQAGRHTTREFNVIYTTDAAAARTVPFADYRNPVVEILGDSFTFGHGVEDDQTYPAVLQRWYWPQVAVRNRAVMGWGTGQAFLALKRDVNRGEHWVRIVYGWLLFHNQRNSRNRQWLEMVGKAKQRQPLFMLENGQAVWKGLVGPEGALPEGDPELAEAEWQITESLVEQMAWLSRKRGVQFTLVVLPINTGESIYKSPLERFEAFLRSKKIDYLNLYGDSSLRKNDLYYPVDGHPKPEWHRRVAAALARSLPLKPDQRR
jgi:hypothetical protein